MMCSTNDYVGADMSVVSPKTLVARDQLSAILVRHACGKLTLAEAEHEAWKIVNHLTDDYDNGYNAGYRAAEEEYLMRKPKPEGQ